MEQLRLDGTQPATYSGARRESLSPASTGQPAVEENDDRHPQDQGCQFSDSCLTCPLPKCKHEMSKGQVKAEAKKLESLAKVAYINRKGTHDSRSGRKAEGVRKNGIPDDGASQNDNRPRHPGRQQRTAS